MLFAHLDNICVKQGTPVADGAAIGDLGNTGLVRSKSGDGSHLHYEVGDVDENGKFTPSYGDAVKSDGCPLSDCSNVTSTPAVERCAVSVPACRPHNGTDMDGKKGDKVATPHGGEVVKAGWENEQDKKPGWGQYVIIDVVKEEKKKP